MIVEQALFLNEIDEHEAVEHERGVPLAVSFDTDALDKGVEGGMFFLEAIVEFLGDFLDIEGFSGTAATFPGYRPALLPRS